MRRDLATGCRGRWGVVAVLALTPYLALKLAWAAGARLGYSGAGPANHDPRHTPDWLRPLFERGLDPTLGLALAGCALALALTTRAPLPAPYGAALTALGTAGAVGLGAVAAAGLAVLLAGRTGFAAIGPSGHAGWVGYLAYVSFAGYAAALGMATRDHRRARRAALPVHPAPGPDASRRAPLDEKEQIMTAISAAIGPALVAGRVPRWAEWAARAVPLLALPSSLWRIALGVGIPVGFTGELAELYAAPGWITPYVFALSLAVEAVALLTLGLVRPWGEVVPHWVPRFGGRTLPAGLVVTVATLGVVALVLIAVPTVALWNGPENMGDPDAPQGLAGVVMTAAYAPQLAWPILLAAVTVAYYRRRRRRPAQAAERARAGAG